MSRKIQRHTNETWFTTWPSKFETETIVLYTDTNTHSHRYCVIKSTKRRRSMQWANLGDGIEKKCRTKCVVPLTRHHRKNIRAHFQIGNSITLIETKISKIKNSFRFDEIIFLLSTSLHLFMLIRAIASVHFNSHGFIFASFITRHQITPDTGKKFV